MANHYVRAHFLIPAETDEELDWWICTLNHAATCVNEDVFEGYSEEVDTAFADQEINPVDAQELGEWFVDRTYRCVIAGSNYLVSPHLWAVFIQAFIRKFHPQCCFTFEFSLDCSARTFGGYGGGAYYIDAIEARYMDTSGWCIDRTAEKERKLLKVKTGRPFCCPSCGTHLPLSQSRLYDRLLAMLGEGRD